MNNIYSKENECDPLTSEQQNSLSSETDNVKNFIKLGSNLGPTRDQDSIGYCYAFSGADMLEHWLKSKGEMPANQNISALALGLNYHKKDWEKKSGEFHSLAIKREALLPRIKEIQNKKDELWFNSTKIDKQLNDLKNSFYKKQGKLKEINDLSEKIDEEYENPEYDFAKASSLEEELDKLESTLSSMMQVDPEFKDKLALLTQQQNEIKKEFSHYQNVLSNLEDQIKAPSEKVIPENGETTEAINNAWPRICLENEVNSRNTSYVEFYNQYRSLFENSVYTPNNTIESIGYLSVNQRNSDKNSCVNFLLAKKMFPTMPFEKPDEFTNFLKGLKVYENLFESLLEKSCKKDRFSKRPTYKNEFVSYTLPIKDNEIVFKNIDEALRNGQIPFVGYRANIFNKSDLTDNEDDHHASTIIGSFSRCGTPYYILRNSWGKEACNEKKGSFQYSASDENKFDSIEMKLKLCKINAISTAKKQKEVCTTDDCFTLAESLKSEKIFLCYKKADMQKQKLVPQPFYCDSDGNFVVTKSHLKKAVYDSSYINN